MKKIICITGASSGIGRHLVGYAIDHGWRVIATVRKLSDRDSLLSEFPNDLKVIILDIAKEEDRMEGLKQLNDALQGESLFALINNAGIVAAGPLMYLDLEDVKSQFEVNVFGLLRWTQLVASDFEKGPERIVNISSVSGLITSPFTGAYSMSKFAVEALSDGLRRELSAWNKKVIVIEPGPIKTPIWQKSADVGERFKHTPYEPLLAQAKKVLENTEENAIAPIEVSRTIIDALESRKPKTRYIVAKRAWMYWLVSRCLPDRWVDKMLVKDRLNDKSRTRPF